MGMFDWVKYKDSCPNCNRTLMNFQTKDDDCGMEYLHPLDVDNFYEYCKCGAWIQFDWVDNDGVYVRTVELNGEVQDRWTRRVSPSEVITVVDLMGRR